MRELVQPGLERLGIRHVGPDADNTRREVGGADRLGDLRVGRPQERESFVGDLRCYRLPHAFRGLALNEYRAHVGQGVTVGLRDVEHVLDLPAPQLPTVAVALVAVARVLALARLIRLPGRRAGR